MNHPAMEALYRKAVSLTITGEDGCTKQVHGNAGASESQLVAFETANGIRLPADFRCYLALANGGQFYDLHLMGVNELLVFDQALLCFHNWGNGDFDCLLLQSGAVLFMNHGPSITVRVADSFSSWLKQIVLEFEQYGFVAHPGDYRELPHDHAGVYRFVLRELEHVDCELNR